MPIALLLSAISLQAIFSDPRSRIFVWWILATIPSCVASLNPPCDTSCATSASTRLDNMGQPPKPWRFSKDEVQLMSLGLFCDGFSRWNFVWGWVLGVKTADLPRWKVLEPLGLSFNWVFWRFIASFSQNQCDLCKIRFHDLDVSNP